MHLKINIRTLCLRGWGIHAKPAFFFNIFFFIFFSSDFYYDALIIEPFYICLVISESENEYPGRGFPCALSYLSYLCDLQEQRDVGEGGGGGGGGGGSKVIKSSFREENWPLYTPWRGFSLLWNAAILKLYCKFLQSY